MMKILFSVGAAFATIVVAFVAGVNMGQTEALLSGMATMGGFICYAIWKNKE